ncbi:hypothetical protein F4775DRAFT_566325 [Biscogniauxia sp. FL1348]|nr:hypothetical protein F4775DRAFT_566323 [Biscogniauxia sp. FL1348]KAI0596061.1 hypothetical protein F4775DRAFT_566325 [Biscogniauxia sp. FL1348]
MEMAPGTSLPCPFFSLLLFFCFLPFRLSSYFFCVLSIVLTLLLTAFITCVRYLSFSSYVTPLSPLPPL